MPKPIKVTVENALSEFLKEDIIIAEEGFYEAEIIKYEITKNKKGETVVACNYKAIIDGKATKVTRLCKSSNFSYELKAQMSYSKVNIIKKGTTLSALNTTMKGTKVFLKYDSEYHTFGCAFKNDYDKYLEEQKAPEAQETEETPE